MTWRNISEYDYCNRATLGRKPWGSCMFGDYAPTFAYCGTTENSFELVTPGSTVFSKRADVAGPCPALRDTGPGIGNG